MPRGNGDIDYFIALVLVCQRKQQKRQGIQVNTGGGEKQCKLAPQIY